MATAFVCIQSYFHHEEYGQARTLPDAVRIVRRHLFRTSSLSASPSHASESDATELAGPVPAATEQAHAEAAPLEVQCAKRHPVKGLVKTLAYIVCLLFLLFIGLVVQELVTLK